MTRGQCSGCRHFYLVDGEGAGRCRRYPPVAFVPPTVGVRQVWEFPEVSFDFWCGEFSAAGSGGKQDQPQGATKLPGLDINPFGS